LIPNHALDLRDETQQRFWPVRRRVARDADAVVAEAAELLRRIVAAGHRRFPLALGITAGIDSRLVLAACREFREDVLYFTFCRHRDRETEREDVRTPARMLARLSLPHHVFYCDAPDDPALAADFAASVCNPFQHRLDQVRDLDRHLAPDCVRLSGHFGETARAMFSARIDRSPRSLARRFFKGTVPAATSVIRPWFEEARAAAERCDYTVRDLHYWESRVGRWAASSQNQYDLARETFAPLACRALVELLLSVDASQRVKQLGSPLSLRIVRELWPELADEPVNPHRDTKEAVARGRSLRRRAHKWLRRGRRGLRARLPG